MSSPTCTRVPSSTPRPRTSFRRPNSPIGPGCASRSWWLRTVSTGTPSGRARRSIPLNWAWLRPGTPPSSSGSPGRRRWRSRRPVCTGRSHRFCASHGTCGGAESARPSARTPSSSVSWPPPWSAATRATDSPTRRRSSPAPSTSQDIRRPRAAGTPARLTSRGANCAPGSCLPSNVWPAKAAVLSCSDTSPWTVSRSRSTTGCSTTYCAASGVTPARS